MSEQFRPASAGSPAGYGPGHTSRGELREPEPYRICKTTGKTRVAQGEGRDGMQPRAGLGPNYSQQEMDNWEMGDARPFGGYEGQGGYGGQGYGQGYGGGMQQYGVQQQHDGFQQYGGQRQHSGQQQYGSQQQIGSQRLQQMHDQHGQQMQQMQQRYSAYDQQQQQQTSCGAHSSGMSASTVDPHRTPNQRPVGEGQDYSDPLGDRKVVISALELARVGIFLGCGI